MRKLKKHSALIITSILVLFAGLVIADPPAKEIYLKKAAKDGYVIRSEVIRKVKIPSGYHEGLLLDGENIWVCNGYGINTWIMGMASGEKKGELKGPGGFTEAITKINGDKYWVSDWKSKKLYLAYIKDNKLIPESEISLAPDHPTGVIWTGKSLFAVTWARGAGTKYYLLKMDKDGNVLQRILIKRIKEPSQLAWDGRYLWISSWFQRRVYKVDAENLEILGFFRSNVDKTTGIAFDGETFWLTGTSSDLYQIRLPE